LSRYKFRVGIEEELFIVNSRGFLVKAAEPVSKVLANMLRESSELLEIARKFLFGLQWEPNPSQIEYVTHPLPIEAIREAIIFGRELIAKAAKKLGLLIYVGSMHPVQSSPFPINGTHINISVWRRNNRKLPIRTLQYVYNNIRNHLPELISLSANTPICAGEYSGFMSSRLRFSRVLKKSSFAKLRRMPLSIVPRSKRTTFKYIILFNKPKKQEYKLVAHETGSRLLDITPRGPITNIVEDYRKSIRETRIEIRVFDNQSDERFLIDLIKITLALALEGLHKMIRGERIKEKSNLIENRDRAIRDGIDAFFLFGNEEISAYEAVEEMIERVSEYLDALGLKLESPLAKLQPEIKYYGMPKILDENDILRRLILRGKNIIRVKLGSNRKLLDYFGNEINLPTNSVVGGILIRDYKLKWVGDDSKIIRRFTEIRKRYWVMTTDGYVRLMSNDEIIEAKSAAEYLSEKLEMMYLNEKIND